MSMKLQLVKVEIAKPVNTSKYDGVITAFKELKEDEFSTMGLSRVTTGEVQSLRNKAKEAGIHLYCPKMTDAEGNPVVDADGNELHTVHRVAQPSGKGRRRSATVTA